MEEFERDEAYLRARKRLEKIKGFYSHLATYVIVNIFIIAVIWIGREEGQSFWNFGTFATAIFWGIGLAFHAFHVFGVNFLFGKDWEDRKLREYMDKYNKERWE